MEQFLFYKLLSRSRQRFRIAGVHETAVVPCSSQIRVMNGHSVRLSIEAPDQPRIGTKLLRASVELTYVAQNNAQSSMHRPNHPPYSNLLIAILTQVAYLLAVGGWANYREPALIVWNVFRADIEKSCSIGELDDIIDVCGNADISIREPVSIRSGYAGQLAKFVRRTRSSRLLLSLRLTGRILLCGRRDARKDRSQGKKRNGNRLERVPGKASSMSFHNIGPDLVILRRR